MGREAGTLRAVRRLLGPARRRWEYERKVFLMWGFRRVVDELRSMDVLPRPAVAGARMRLLIVNLTPHLGDVVMQMPMIEALREALREASCEARVEYAVEESAAPLLRLMPELDHVYALRLGRTPPIGFWPSVRWSWRVMREYWRVMRGCEATVCLLPRWGDDLFRSMLVAYLSGAPRRIGFAWEVMPMQPPAPYRDAFLTQLVRGGWGMHEPVRFCLLASAAGLMPEVDGSLLSETKVGALERIAASEDWVGLAERLGIEAEQKFAVLAPGASAARRMWPTERWVQVFDAVEAMGLRVVVLSGVADAEIAERLHEATGRRGVLAAGKTSVAESTALIGHAALFVGADSGPGHLAGALGVATVILFVAADGHDVDGTSSPERMRPMGPFVACCRPRECVAPCVGSCVEETAHCIQGIAAEDVIAAARVVMERREAGVTR